MKKFAIVLMVLALLAGSAMAGKVYEKPVRPVESLRADFTHFEGGDACTDEAEYNIIAADGLTYEGYAATGEYDWYELFVVTATNYTLTTSEGSEPTIDDTKLYVYDGDCLGDISSMNQIAYNDDISYPDNAFSSVTVYLEPGSYYAAVQAYPYGTHEGNYVLTMTEEEPPPPPPANDVCTGAIDLQVQGLVTFDVDLTDGYTNQSGLGSGGCTNYSANGPEAFYMITLAAGESFTVTEAGTCDMSIYLFTDCADPMASCVAGADSGSPEVLTYVAEADGVYYLAVDAYSSAGCPVTVTIDAPVATEDASFGTLKAMYR